MLVCVISVGLLMLPTTVNGDNKIDTELRAIEATLDQADQGMLKIVAELDGKMPPGELVTPPESMLVDLLDDIVRNPDRPSEVLAPMHNAVANSMDVAE